MWTSDDGARYQTTAWESAIWESAIRPLLVRAVGGFSWADEHAFLRRWFEPVPGLVVDLACGGGAHGRLLAQRLGPQRIVAVDRDEAVLRRAWRHPQAAQIQHLAADAGALPFADGALGGAICFGGLSLFDDPDAALAELRRCMAPGAPLVGLCPQYRATRRQRLARLAMRQHFFEAEQLESMLQRHRWQRLQLQGRGWTMLYAARAI